MLSKYFGKVKYEFSKFIDSRSWSLLWRRVSINMTYLRVLFILSLITFNYNSLLDISVLNWKFFLFLLSAWILIEYLIDKPFRKKDILTVLGIAGFYRLTLLYFNSHPTSESFYAAPDSGIYRRLAKSLYDCFEYSMYCGEQPYFKRPPAYSAILSIFTFGGNLAPLLLIILQTLLIISIFYIVWVQLEKNYSNKYNFIPIIFACIAPVTWVFARIVLSDIWGVFFVTLAWYLSSKEQVKKYRNSPIWLILLILSLLLQLQYFSGVFLFYFKSIVKENNKEFRLKTILNILLVLLIVFLWGNRATNYYGAWDFNPYIGCYIEKNIIEASEAKKYGMSIHEIRDIGKTYLLLEDDSIANQSIEPEVCESFLRILPKYLIDNISYVSDHYTEFIRNIFLDINTCQYKKINCESGYWLWLNTVSTTILFMAGLAVMVFKKNFDYYFDFLIYLFLFLFITIFVGVDAPRMRILFEPYFFFIFGLAIQKVFSTLDEISNR